MRGASEWARAQAMAADGLSQREIARRLVFDLRLEAGADPDTIVANALDRVWPAWRVCVAE